MKKLAILISLIATGNVIAETANNQMVIRIPKMETIKADEMGTWDFNRYEYSNIQAPVLKSSGEFLPSIINQETPFTQVKEDVFTVNKDRTEVLVNSKTLAEKYGTTVNINEDINETVSRNVVPQVGSWINVGGENCGGWSPSTVTYLSGFTFTQTRQCDQNQEKTINYFANSVQIDTKTLTRVNTTQQSQQAVGTKTPENLTPASSGQKITLLNSSVTEWQNKAIINGRMFNGVFNLYSDQECVSLGDSGTQYVDFTVQEPLKMRIIGNMPEPLYSNGRKLSLYAKDQPNTLLKQVTLTSNGSAQLLDYILMPNIIYRLRGTSTVFCEIGAVQ